MKELIQQLLAIENFDVFLVLGILIFFGLIESFAGYLRHSKRKKGDWLQEVMSFFLLSSGIKPAIVASVYILGNTIYPEGADLLSQQSFIAVFFGYILIDDLLQYWYHRSAHEYPFLWKLHRSHHQAEEMGFFVSYRNALLYYIMMPNIWWVGCIVFAGGAKAVALGLVIKQAIIISSHSRIKWDKPFYQYAFLKPFIKVIERVIITPSFHHSHHGTSMLDNSSDPNANFGNMFSLWDQFFGTAKFQTAYPQEYGLYKKTEDDWTAAYFYPFVKSKDKKSDWHRDFELTKTSTNEALKVQLTKGESYLWCACGKSSQQPFCDGSHHGSKVKPLKFTAKRTGEVKLCNCKATKKGPFCDDTHLNL
jgi:sterol desaturase/sphingolipid hydroxylase (fatty acid hydroxylase superfamily)/CDGSH-type Zn-finger protein